MFSVLPFGNRTVIETLTGAQLETAFLNGFSPVCNPAFTGGTGRFPQISGLKVTFTCNGTDAGHHRHVEDPGRDRRTGRRPSARPTASGS